MTGRARARVSRSLSLLLGLIGAISPRAAFGACDALGLLWSITSRRPRRAELRTLFPDLPRAECGRVLRRIWSSHARTAFLGGWIRRGGISPIHTLVRENAAVRALQPPAIVGTFHVGPTLGLGALPERLRGQTLVLRGNTTLMKGTDQQRAAMFSRAIERLGENGFVLMALDPREAQRIAVPFLGGTLQLARGPFAMARVARVPIVPLVARWEGDAIELIVGEPLPVGNDEQAIAAAAGQWLERYLRESPGELSYRILELMTI